MTKIVIVAPFMDVNVKHAALSVGQRSAAFV